MAASSAGDGGGFPPTFLFLQHRDSGTMDVSNVVLLVISNLLSKSLTSSISNPE